MQFSFQVQNWLLFLSCFICLMHINIINTIGKRDCFLLGYKQRKWIEYKDAQYDMYRKKTHSLNVVHISKYYWILVVTFNCEHLIQKCNNFIQLTAGKGEVSQCAVNSLKTTWFRRCMTASVLLSKGCWTSVWASGDLIILRLQND